MKELSILLGADGCRTEAKPNRMELIRTATNAHPTWNT